RWAVDAGDAVRAQAAAGALWRFWQQRGHLAEGRRWLGEGPGHPAGEGPRPRPGPRPGRGRGGSPGGPTGGRPAPTTTRPWPSSGGSTTPPAWPRPSTTRRSPSPPRTTGTRRPACWGGPRPCFPRRVEEALALFRRLDDEPGVARVLTMLLVPDAMAGAWEQVIAELEEVVAI